MFVEHFRCTTDFDLKGLGLISERHVQQWLWEFRDLAFHTGQTRNILPDTQNLCATITFELSGWAAMNLNGE